MAKIELFYRIEKFDKDGKKIYDSGKRKSRSFVRQFLQILNLDMQKTTKSVTDTSNTVRSFTSPSWSNWCSTGGATGVRVNALNAPVGSSDYGILAGTSDAAKTPSDYNLASKIVHGIGAGQLYHQAMTVNDPVVSGNNVNWVLRRQFNNSSGGAITVKEIGLVLRRVSPDYYFLVIRDVLAAPQIINNDQALTVEFTISTTV